MSGKGNAIIWVVAGCLGVYVGSYIILSSRGRYVPGAWGLSTVKWYEWAPEGYVSGQEGTRRNLAFQLFFLLAWIVDNKFIHTFEKARSGQYPINSLLEHELQVSTSNWNTRIAAEANIQNPQGGTIESQPPGSDTNQTPGTDVSRRSP
jgi:hypothetical protein